MEGQPSFIPSVSSTPSSSFSSPTASSSSPSTTIVMAETPPSPPQREQKKTKTFELTAHSIFYVKPTAVHALKLLLNQCRPSQPTHYILRDVSLTARPGELLAVVGPSGAGKSTLLDILAARTAPTAGSLRLNSSPLHPASFRRLSAHVPQHDASLPLLTVAETFAFAARLLLPRHASASASAVIASLLADLRLSHLAHTRLSGNLSGGERRRVSIGLSLLRDPAVLLLDEPTSGLDSSSAHLVLQSLRSVAASRSTTIILSIHQPSSRLLSSIDSLLLLSKGSVIHHGSLSSLDRFLLSAGFSVPSQLNPLEFAMEVLHQLPHPTTTLKAQRASSTKLIEPKIQEEEEEEDITVHYSSSRVREILTLYGRCWKLVFRTKQLLLANTIEALIVGFLLGTIYINLSFDDEGIGKRLGLFAFTLTFLLSSTTETLPIFVGERPILLRDTSSGLYRLSSHLVAGTLVFVPYLLAISLLYATSVYFITGLCASWAAFTDFVLIVWALVLTANSFVLFVSSLAPDYIAGTSLVTVSLAGFFLFSGYFIAKESMPEYWVFVHYLSPYKYGLDALLANEYSCQANRCFEWAGKEMGGGCLATGRDVLARRGLREGERWANLQVLFGFFAFYRVLYWIVLRRRASMSKK
ncbi:ABC transporter G family member 4-like [Musa acuminata AAA Group]|uniref:ABC transporter G family member 4-like n=1 Tax=Musa acuminata AAA Group TaxID=214697 RepID=UPI0031D2BF12